MQLEDVPEEMTPLSSFGLMNPQIVLLNVLTYIVCERAANQFVQTELKSNGNIFGSFNYYPIHCIGLHSQDSKIPCTDIMPLKRFEK